MTLFDIFPRKKNTEYSGIFDLLTHWRSVIEKTSMVQNLPDSKEKLDDELTLIERSTDDLSRINALILTSHQAIVGIRSAQEQPNDILEKSLSFYGDLAISSIRRSLFREKPNLPSNSESSVRFSVIEEVIIRLLNEQKSHSELKRLVFKLCWQQVLFFSYVYQDSSSVEESRTGRFMRFSDAETRTIDVFVSAKDVILESLKSLQGHSKAKIIEKLLELPERLLYKTYNLGTGIPGTAYADYVKEDNRPFIEPYSWIVSQTLWTLTNLIKELPARQLQLDKILNIFQSYGTGVLDCLLEHYQSLKYRHAKKDKPDPPYETILEKSEQIVRLYYNLMVTTTDIALKDTLSIPAIASSSRLHLDAATRMAELVRETSHIDLPRSINEDLPLLGLVAQKISKAINIGQREQHYKRAGLTDVLDSRLGFSASEDVEGLSYNEIVVLFNSLADLISESIDSDNPPHFVDIHQSGFFLSHLVKLLLSCHDLSFLFRPSHIFINRYYTSLLPLTFKLYLPKGSTQNTKPIQTINLDDSVRTGASARICVSFLRRVAGAKVAVTLVSLFNYNIASGISESHPDALTEFKSVLSLSSVVRGSKISEFYKKDSLFLTTKTYTNPGHLMDAIYQHFRSKTLEALDYVDENLKDVAANFRIPHVLAHTPFFVTIAVAVARDLCRRIYKDATMRDTQITISMISGSAVFGRSLMFAVAFYIKYYAEQEQLKIQVLLNETNIFKHLNSWDNKRDPNSITVAFESAVYSGFSLLSHWNKLMRLDPAGDTEKSIKSLEKLVTSNETRNQIDFVYSGEIINVGEFSYPDSFIDVRSTLKS